MSDMRATERLLEVIENQVSEFLPNFSEAVEAIQELRRRGDTLVRADDLRLAVDVFTSNGTFSLCSGWEHPDKPMLLAARDRLENALGANLGAAGACHIEKPA